MSGAANSGSGGGEVASIPVGNSFSTGICGTSAQGTRADRRPDLESSNSNCVARVLRMDTDLWSAVARQSGCQTVDFLAGSLFRNADQAAIGQFRIPAREWNTGEVAAIQRFGELLADSVRGVAEDEFFECRAVEAARESIARC